MRTFLAIGGIALFLFGVVGKRDKGNGLIETIRRS